MSAVRSWLPGAAVVAGVFALRVGLGEPAVRELAGTYGLVLYGAGLALSWVFHRSRAFIALGVLAWLNMAVVGPAERTELLPALGTVVLALLGLLGVARDRGILSRVGAIQVLGFATLASLSGYVLADPGLVEQIVARPEVALALRTVWPGYAAATVAVAVWAGLAIGWAIVRYRGPLEHAFAWVALLLLAAIHPAVSETQAAVLLVAAGLTVTVALVETSYVMAYRDELTGLPGRRALMQALDDVQGTYTLAMVDVDHFKKFNDKHGHDVGDQVLKLVATRLGRAPGGAKAYRYGGEEFTLLFPGRVREDALEHLEAVRAAIEHARFSVRSWRRPRKKPETPRKTKRKPKNLSVTVSIGMADTTGKASAPEEILKKADEALYRAKKKGRNQVSK